MISPQRENKSRHVYDNRGISVLRAGRELEMATTSLIGGPKQMNNDAWWGLEILFPPQMDDAMGVNLIKQGVRPKDYVKTLLERSTTPPGGGPSRSSPRQQRRCW